MVLIQFLGKNVDDEDYKKIEKNLIFIEKTNLLQQIVFCTHFCFEENYYQSLKNQFRYQVTVQKHS